MCNKNSLVSVIMLLQYKDLKNLAYYVLHIYAHHVIVNEGPMYIFVLVLVGLIMSCCFLYCSLINPPLQSTRIHATIAPSLELDASPPQIARPAHISAVT